MIKEGKFGCHEAFWLTTIAIVAKVFFSSPTTLSELVGNTGWIVTIISALTALLGFFFIYLLLKSYPEKEIVEVYELSLGGIFGFIFSGILALYMLFVEVTRISEFTEVLRVYVFPLSPNWFISGLFIACVYIFSVLGLENIARVSRLLVYFMLMGFVVVLALGIQNYDTNNFYPIFGYGLGKTAITGIVRSSVYGEVIVLAVFARSFQGVNNIRNEGLIGIALSGLLISVSLLAFNLTFPYFTAQEITAPMYEMATLIDYGRFLQRLEPIFLFIWIISSLISASVVFYSFIWIYCKLFNIQDDKPVILAASTALYSLALMHKDIVTIVFGDVPFLRAYGSIVFFVMPLLSLVITAIRKGGANKNA